MSTNLEAIESIESLDPLALDDVHGGAGQDEKGNIGVTVPTPKGNIQVGVQAERSRTNYAKCVDAVTGMPNATPQSIVDTCGKPPA